MHWGTDYAVLTYKETFADAFRTAGGGEAFLDACLYLKGWIKDTEAYVALYGLEPEKVLSCVS